MFKGDSIRGAGMIILQFLRALTIITLLSTTVASWTLIIKVDTSNRFFFFDAASLFFTSNIAVFLVVSELPIAKPYFRRTWPVLSDQAGLTWLGFATALIGCNLLGKLNQSANSVKNLGLPFWRLVLSAGVLAITFGIVNIICSFIFRDSANGIHAKVVRSDGSLSAPNEDSPSYKEQYSIRSNSLRNDKPKATFMSFFWKSKDKKAGTTYSRPEISAPISSQQYDVERNAPYSPASYTGTPADEQGWDRNDRRSPIAPEIRRPDTALHPLNTKHARHSSRYSEAHMSRF
ncbi:hypothetical protein B0J13DRAFT_277243 [Dactylonectria estremocensis]|uniref:DUF7598 domain-containing protein n=1 Tax=Dactylonectria estremocensis TaxID=1079267 RepID=A0A9P9F160_9HYPO|nr:hypothetical protein B0J13DRAFT_277243 [Dactylonectria estremocensis]